MENKEIEITTEKTVEDSSEKQEEITVNEAKSDKADEVENKDTNNTHNTNKEIAGKKDNIYIKLAKMRVELQRTKLKKSGMNGFAKFKYFELFDFLPAINDIALEHNVVNIISFSETEATLKIINIDNPEENIVFSIKMANASVKGASDIQNLGASCTYLRRYLYMIAYEICESDTIDSMDSNANKKNNANNNVTKIYKCHVCGKSISAEIYRKSIDKYGVPLCSGECVSKAMTQLG